MSRLKKDVLERAFWTAAETFLAVWVIADLQTVQTAAAAALAAGLSVVKSYAATKVGDPDSAALIKD